MMNRWTMRFLPVLLLIATNFHNGLVLVLGQTSCSVDDDCQENVEYCSESNICREFGACGEVRDCRNPSNIYPVIACVGTLYCSNNGQCGKNCNGVGGGPLGCFSSTSTCIEETKGQILVQDLTVGDRVLTRSSSMPDQFQTVYAIDHKDASKRTDFIQIHFCSEVDDNDNNSLSKTLEVTPSHMVFLHGEKDPVAASHLNVGDAIETKTISGDHNAVVSSSVGTITKISHVSRDGLWNPITTDGTIVVDGVVASTYSVPPFVKGPKESSSSRPNSMLSLFGGIIQLGSPHDVLHRLMAPYRILCMVFPSSYTNSYYVNGYNLYSTIGTKLLDTFAASPGILQDFTLLATFASCCLFTFLFSSFGVVTIATTIAWLYLFHHHQRRAIK